MSIKKLEGTKQDFNEKDFFPVLQILNKNSGKTFERDLDSFRISDLLEENAQILFLLDPSFNPETFLEQHNNSLHELQTYLYEIKAPITETAFVVRIFKRFP